MDTVGLACTLLLLAIGLYGARHLRPYPAPHEDPRGRRSSDVLSF